MGILASSSSNILLGTVAGMTIFLGLPVARWKNASEQLRGALALASAGVLIFLIIEVGFHAIETVESTAKGGDLGSALFQGLILVVGLVVGLVGLAWWEEERGKKRTEGATPLDIATMIATGIGLHNFAEGLAIGQTFSGGQVALGSILVIGFALHNATEGFGIAGPLAGQDVGWGRLIVLGLIGGAPTALGSLIGGSFVNPNVELLFLSLAVGSLIYVTRELLRLRFNALGSVNAMTALSIGLLAGIGSEIFVEVASSQNSKSTAAPAVIGAAEIHFKKNETDPATIQVERGASITLVNETENSLEMESKGLIAGEAFIPAHGKVAVKVIGPEGQYALGPELGGAATAKVIVEGGKVAAQDDLAQLLAAITTIEGHANASHDLHLRALSGKSPNAALDLKRAGKHAHHPMHELLQEKTPQAMAVQESLQKFALLDRVKEDIEDLSKLAADKSTEPKQFENSYNAIIEVVSDARKRIAGNAYNDPKLKAKIVLALLAMAEGEYKEAVEDGEIKVVEPAVPGKDLFLEYQDTRGFLKACDRILDTMPESDFKPDGRKALGELLDKQFLPVDPADPKHPIPFKEIEEQFERVERSIS